MSQVIRFEKIVPEGKAMGRLKDGRAVFAIGPLPDETARVGIRKHKRTFAEAVLREIVEPSPRRTAPAEDHAIVCSPWQGVDYSYQCQLKAEMLQETMRQHRIDFANIKLLPSPQQVGYRNRLDFTLAQTEAGLQLAFHQRGSWEELVPLPVGCKLGSAEMNAAALNLVAQLAQLPTNITPGTVTVRHAQTTGALLTILTTGARADWSHIDTKELGNFVVTRPLKGSGAPGPVIFQSGKTFITERVSGIELTYPYDGFFQVNTKAFEVALKRIMPSVESSQRIVELYSGVGAIGLPLASTGSRVHGIEIINSAAEFAERNARANHLSNYTAEARAAEQIDATTLAGADCVIVDPPRAGLHPKVRHWITEAEPETIVYLSCNPVTQARDIALLQDHYELESITGFDFYPGTLHMESLAILRR